MPKFSTQFHQGELYDAYRYLGCQYDAVSHSAVFRVYAPRATEAYLVGSFNNWNNEACPMTKRDDGIFETTVEGVEEFDSYKYYLVTDKGGIYKADPYAFHAETEGGTNSKVFDLRSIVIKDSKYLQERKERNPYRAPMNIYEAHIGSWRRYEDGNTFSYVKFADEIVPYLTQMHYTHLELVGISEHPFDGSWGYQVTGYYAPTARFGTPRDFAYLIEKCHKAGIGVIVDWVPGHFPKDSFGLIDFDGYPLYEPTSEKRKEHKEWGTRCFDYGKAEVQTFLCSSAMMWFDVYHVDGLRVDAVASMLYLDYGRKDGEWEANYKGGNENLEAVAFLQKLNTKVFSTYPDVLMIAEESTAWPMVTKPVDMGGLGFNFKWNMGWMNDSLDYAKTDPIGRGNVHDRLTFSLTYAFSENYILPISHDEVVHGKCSLVDKMPGLYDAKFAGLRNFLMNMYAHPGKKLLFMGTEFGQFIEWNYKQELDWKLLTYPMHDSTQRFVSELNKFYCKRPAMWKRDDGFEGYEWLVVDDKNQNVIVYQRKDDEGNRVIVVLNFSFVKYEKYRFGVDEGVYTERLVSTMDGWSKGGKRKKSSKKASHGKGNSLVMDLEPMSGYYLTGTVKGDKV